MASQKDTKNRITSVKNIQKITRAMEMVAAARLRRAEQRIEAMRPYADAIRRMTGRVVEAVGAHPDMPLLEEHDEIKNVGLLLVTGDRGLAGPFNSQIIRAGNRRERELRGESKEVVWYASGKRGRVLARVPRQRRGDRPPGLHRPARLLQRPRPGQRHRRASTKTATSTGWR